MLNKRFIEIIVGLFMIAGMLALFGLAFKVSSSGPVSYTHLDVYKRQL